MSQLAVEIFTGVTNFDDGLWVSQIFTMEFSHAMGPLYFGSQSKPPDKKNLSWYSRLDRVNHQGRKQQEEKELSLLGWRPDRQLTKGRLGVNTSPPRGGSALWVLRQGGVPEK